MCIRDRTGTDHQRFATGETGRTVAQGRPQAHQHQPRQPRCCLLYTSDAADERSSVDLGGRRIIKKKKQQTNPRITAI